MEGEAIAGGGDITNTIEAYSPRYRTKVLNALVKCNLSFRIKVDIALSPSVENLFLDSTRLIFPIFEVRREAGAFPDNKFPVR